VLPGREALQHLLAHRARLDAGDEVARHVHRDIRLEQRPAHVAQRFADVVGREPSLAGERAEDALQPVGE
jgi:hypothetical protein